MIFLFLSLIISSGSIAFAGESILVEGVYSGKLDWRVGLVARTPEESAAIGALEYCERIGFSVRQAFYFEFDGNRLFVTDVICSRDQMTDNTPARAFIMRRRQARGAALTSEALQILERYKGIDIDVQE